MCAYNSLIIHKTQGLRLLLAHQLYVCLTERQVGEIKLHYL